MNWLKNLWNSMKDPIEEALKAAIAAKFAPYLDGPKGPAPAGFWEEIAKADPTNGDKLAAEWKAFALAQPTLAAGVLKGARAVALNLAEKINPDD